MTIIGDYRHQLSAAEYTATFDSVRATFRAEFDNYGCRQLNIYIHDGLNSNVFVSVTEKCYTITRDECYLVWDDCSGVLASVLNLTFDQLVMICRTLIDYFNDPDVCINFMDVWVRSEKEVH